jgi:hypothetical protein
MPNTLNNGAVSPITQDSEKSNATRMINASDRPVIRARSRCSSGSLPDRIEMKMTLSTPRTTSRTSSVRKATQASGLSRRSITSL